MNRIAFSVAVLLTCAWAGCSSSSESDRSWTEPSVQDTTAQERKANFETRTDTVTTEGTKQRAESSSLFNSAQVRFMVQIGSFTDATNASNVQLTARQRYQLPVVNDYNAARRRYQIRIGFFEMEDTANEFLLKLRTDFPQDYRDAWVVQINK